MIWYVEENERKYPTVIPFHGILLSGMLRKTFRIDELRCCSDVEVLVCNAVKKMYKCWRPKNDERTTNEERRTNERLVRIFAIWLVRIPIDWYEFRSIGTNSDRLVRIPNDWSEFRTIGPNSERMTNDEFNVATDVNASNVVKFDKGLNAQKKIGVDWPRQSQFQKICQTVNVSKLKNRRGLV
jgi:hypothetical protein